MHFISVKGLRRRSVIICMTVPRTIQAVSITTIPIMAVVIIFSLRNRSFAPPAVIITNAPQVMNRPANAKVICMEKFMRFYELEE